MTTQTRPAHRAIFYRHLGSWTLAVLVGQLVALGGSVAFAARLAAAPGVAASALVGAVAGISIGAAQWPALRRAVDHLGVDEWIPASAIGGALVGILAWIAAACGPHDVSSLWTLAFAAVASGLVAGSILGGLQALALRHRPGVARRWWAANTVGWAFGLLFVLGGVLATLLGPWPGAPVTAAIICASITAMAMIVAWTTALVLPSSGR